MRTFLMISVLGAATPAAAQFNPFQLDELRAQQQAADRRAIDQANQLQALEARLRADQASADLAVQRAGAHVPARPYGDPTLGAAPAPPVKYPSMPDAALAESNKRVRDAAGNRH